ncbi:MAG: hypothetical protein KDK38_15795 [Leptospiraceae bacterium]|nr:hypothetical protein [Leptospiraceae bacterium]
MGNSQMTLSNHVPVLALGRIQRAKGFKGDIRVTSRGELLSSFQLPATVKLYRAEGIRDGLLLNPVFSKEVTLVDIPEVNPDYAVVRFEHYSNVDLIETIKGLSLGIPLQEAREKFADEEEPWLFQYLDCKVINNSAEFGRVVRIEEHGNNTHAVVKMLNDKELLFPLFSPYVLKIDFKNHTIHTENLEWLDPELAD